MSSEKLSLDFKNVRTKLPNVWIGVCFYIIFMVTLILGATAAFEWLMAAILLFFYLEFILEICDPGISQDSE